MQVVIVVLLGNALSLLAVVRPIRFRLHSYGEDTKSMKVAS